MEKAPPLGKHPGSSRDTTTKPAAVDWHCTPYQNASHALLVLNQVDAMSVAHRLSALLKRPPTGALRRIAVACVSPAVRGAFGRTNGGFGVSNPGN